MGTLIQDLRYGLRMLGKSPAFTAVAVVTLALGIGANTAIFSVVNAVLLRPLSFPASDRIMRVVSVRTREKAVDDNVSYPDFLDWRAQNHVFEQMAVFRTDNATLTGQGEPANLASAVVSADLFSLLGVKPALGRTFLPEEDKPGGAGGGDAVILGHRLWETRFGAAPDIVGRTLRLDNRLFTVVGVMPPGFQFPIQATPIDLWRTIAVDLIAPPGEKSMGSQRGAHYLDAIARLKPNVTTAQAKAEMSAIVSSLNKQFSENAPRAVRIEPELDHLAGDVRSALLVLLAAVGCVLLIACANVANLLLARATSRQRELAIRGALGAGRARVIRQLLTESTLLALLGGALGALLALWGADSLVRLIPQDVPRLAEVTLDRRVLLFTTALSFFTGLFFGLAPAMQAARSDLTESLKEGGRGSSEGRHRNQLRSILVVTEVAVALVLLVGAGLLIQSFRRLQRVDPGFNPHGVLTFKLSLPDAQYSTERQLEFFRQLIDRLDRLPGVRSASAALPLPLGGDEADTFFGIDGRPMAEADRPRTSYSWVEPDYFHTMGIALKAGRDFTVLDDLKATPVVIIDETLARRFFPRQNPLGQRIKPEIGNGYKDGPPMREIVGVVGDVRQAGLQAAPMSGVYVPLAQSPGLSLATVVRTDVEPRSLASAVRKEVAAMDKDLPVYDVKTLDDYLAASVAEPHFNTLLLGIFAGLALALAAVGLYGVISYSVTHRTHEIGVRMALGAERYEVLRLVLRQGLLLMLAGVAIGWVAALGLTRLMASLLYGVRPTDPTTFVLVSLLLGGVALLASYIPARRATKVDPLVALRYE